MMNEDKIIIAKKLRKKQTSTEIIMWNELRNRKLLNYKFRRQYSIEGYIVDFYCTELKLTVEIDGPIHENQIEEDIYRQKVIEKRGVKFIRFTNQEVENSLQDVLKNLKDLIKELTPLH